MVESAPRFLADVMLGRLVRWLRAMGYDTLYQPALDDAALAELARREARILLTRDVELTRRKQLRSLLIQDDKPMLQLRQVTRTLRLNDYAAFTRCIECNGELQVVERDAVVALVPPYVFENQSNFRRCGSCGRIYWRGTHWTRMRQILRELEADHETE